MDRLFSGPAESSAARLNELAEFCGPDATTLLRLAEAFENSPTLLAPYSDGSISQAFWDLSSQAFFALGDKSIEFDVRQRVVNSFETLFRDFFAVRCHPVLGHLSEEGSPLNSACFMWWDFGCWFSPSDLSLLPVMRSILAIDHAACQESALHGLGHQHRRHGAATESIIDEFLSRERHLRIELIEYANLVRTGRVL